jgi:hypothetical protein
MSTPADLRLRRRLALLAALAVPPLLVVLYAFPPTETSFYPRCNFHRLTGLHCPGCGTTRCLHALLHGDLPQAVACNLLAVAALPFLLAWAARAGWAALRGAPSPRTRLPAWAIAALIVLVLAFAVVRNLPFFPANLLAPQPLADSAGEVSAAPPQR